MVQFAEEVSLQRLWWKEFTKKGKLMVQYVKSLQCKEWWVVKMEKRKMSWDKHGEVKLVHEIKQEVGSRDEARHAEKSDHAN